MLKFHPAILTEQFSPFTMAEHNMRQSVFAPNETEPEFQKLRRASAEVAAAGEGLYT